MNALRNSCIAGCIALSLLLTGCGSSQTTRYYSLEPQTGSGVRAYSGPVIQIAAFNTPALFDREELFKEVAPGQFEVQEFDHWAAPFGQMARQTFADDLASRLSPGAVCAPGTPVPSNTAQLAINLETYRVIGSSASLQVSWSFRDSSSPPGAWQTHAVLLHTERGDASGGSTAAALNQLLAQLAEQIAVALKTS